MLQRISTNSWRKYMKNWGSVLLELDCRKPA
jgi:hypothetical protein